MVSIVPVTYPVFHTALDSRILADDFVCFFRKKMINFLHFIKVSICENPEYDFFTGCCACVFPEIPLKFFRDMNMVHEFWFYSFQCVMSRIFLDNGLFLHVFIIHHKPVVLSGHSVLDFESAYSI